MKTRAILLGVLVVLFFFVGYSALGNLEDDDSLIEVNFNTTYEIYENFSAHLELAWLTADFGDAEHNTDLDDDIWRSALSFVYTF